MSKLYVNKKEIGNDTKFIKKESKKKSYKFCIQYFFIRHTWYILQRYSTYCWHKI